MNFTDIIVLIFVAVLGTGEQVAMIENHPSIASCQARGNEINEALLQDPNVIEYAGKCETLQAYPKAPVPLAPKRDL